MAEISHSDPVTNPSLQFPINAKDRVLETGAAISQQFEPIKQLCAHLNAFHVYASDPTRCVEANHYCAHINEDIRQCLIYDAPDRNARLIGIEYMITPRRYQSLPESERRLWHSHVFEVKSGLLVMPLPNTTPLPTAAWDVAETKEMEEVVGLYGKTYHLWQVDRGHEVPMGSPELMGSFTKEDQVPKELVSERDKRFGVDSGRKRAKREHISEPEVHHDADMIWKSD